MSTSPAPRYLDTEYQTTHNDLFSHPLTKSIELVLPPGVSKDDFDSAVQGFTEAVGKGAVFTGDGLKDYVDPYEIPEVSGGKKVPSAAVCPASVEEIQAVLKVANRYKIPLWTFSRGKNLGYGGPAPVVSGSVALDLYRINKVIEVNEKHAYAVVEPGVTFTDLYNYCATNKLKVWPSTPSLGWGSVIGNTLDRGMGYLPTGEHHENIASLEVVLANGDIVRTGQFAIPTSQTAHLTQLSFGPSIAGLFIQSNLAIVTKMGFHLTVQPQAYMAVTFDMPNFEDVQPIMDVFGAMRRNGTIPYTAWVSNIIGQTIGIRKRAEWWDGEGSMPDEKIKEIQEELDLGYWIVKFGLYGVRHILQAQFEEVQRIVAKELPTGRLRMTLHQGEEGGLLEATSIDDAFGSLFVGVPNLWTLKFVNYMCPKGAPDSNGAHGAYSPVVPLDGKTLLEWLTSARAIYKSQGYDLIADFYVHQHHGICVCMLFFDKTNAEQRIAIDKLMCGLIEEGGKRGFSTYRSHVAYMDSVADLFGFNDHAYRRFIQTIKDAVDPNGILSPGKMGIWPSKLKKEAQTSKKPASSSSNGGGPSKWAQSLKAKFWGRGR